LSTVSASDGPPSGADNEDTTTADSATQLAPSEMMDNESHWSSRSMEVTPLIVSEELPSTVTLPFPLSIFAIRYILPLLLAEAGNVIVIVLLPVVTAAK
jgi:hypothetical protein